MMRTSFLWATRRAALLGFSAAIGVTAAGPVLAQTPAPAAGAPAAPNAASSDTSSGDTNSGDTAERLAKRRERLEQGAKRLRDRAAELRKQATSGGAAPNSSDLKRPPGNPAERAQKLEEQAQKMEERAKSMTAEDVNERSPEAARQNRHLMRRSHINKRWGAATLSDPEAMAELRVHAERVAKLKRIQFLARAKSKDDPALARAKLILAKEDDRHEQHMKAIQSRVAPGTGTTATTAPAEAK